MTVLGPISLLLVFWMTGEIAYYAFKRWKCVSETTLLDRFAIVGAFACIMAAGQVLAYFQ